MNSVQESKNELDAAIRYAENAISSAKQTIESMEFRQEMAKKQYSEQTGREEALQREVAELKAKLAESKPTMPVIPKAVAIAIFREGVQHGVEAACSEIESTDAIEINEGEYMGGFEVSFSKYIDLDDHLDLDWMRGKCGDYSEERAIEVLGNLCADKEFECRIHGVNDNTIDLTKNN